MNGKAKIKPVLFLWGLLAGTIFMAACDILSFKNEQVTLHPILYSDEDGIYSMREDGGGKNRFLSLGEEQAFYPNRSADGKKIVFNTYLDYTTRGPSIYVTNSDGTGMAPAHVYDDGTTLYGYHPKWSPDGKKIMYSNFDISIYDLAADRHLWVPDSGGSGSWSPDGTKIAFSSNREDFEEEGIDSPYHVYQVELATMEVEKLTGGMDYAESSIWGASGERILFKGSRGGVEGLYVVELETGAIHKIHYPSEETSYQLLAWSDDEQEILVYARDPLVVKSSRTYKYNIVTGDKKLLLEDRGSAGGFDWYQPK